MIPDYDIEVWRNIGGVCTQLDILQVYVNSPAGIDPHTFLMQELIRIRATQTVSGQVAEAEVVFDNDPTKKFAAGDIIMIWLGWEQSQQLIIMRISDYVNCVPGDVGKQVRDDGSEIGTLISYDNTKRTWRVSTSSIVTDPSVITITSGIGSGNTTDQGSSSNRVKVFSGVVYEAASESNDEDKTMTLRAKDWSFLLLTDKFSESYPVSTNARNIVLDILANYIISTESSTPCLVSTGQIYKDDPLYSICHSGDGEIVGSGSNILEVGQANIHTDPHSYAGDLLVDNYIPTFNLYWDFTGSSPYLQSEDANTIDKDTKVNWYEKNDDTHHVNVWSPVHQGWTHNSSDPWLHNNDDNDCIAISAENSYIGNYDEYYSFEDIPTYNSFYFDTGYPVLHIVARKGNGAGGRCGAFGIGIWLKIFSDPTWTHYFDIPSFMDDDEDYHDHYVDISSFISNSLSRFNNLQMKIVLSRLTGGGADKGYIRVTQAYFTVHGWGLTNQGESLDDNYISQFSFGNVPFSSIPGESVTQADITIEARNDSGHNDPDLQHVIYFKISTDNGINWSSSFGAGAPITLDTWETRTVSVLSIVNTVDKINNCRIKISAVAGRAYIGDHDYHETLLRVTKATLTVNASIPATDMNKIWRGFLLFNTGLISSTAIIASAYLTLYPDSKVITQDFDLFIMKDSSNPLVYPHNPLVLNDYDCTHPYVAGPSYDGSLILPSTPFSIALDPTWIIRGDGVTPGSAESRFCLKTDKDLSVIGPGSNEEGTVILESFSGSHPPELHVICYQAPIICEYKVGAGPLIETTVSTRQLDFDGEALTDSMTKTSDATQHDWYVDEEKMVRWFPRRDAIGHIQYRDYPSVNPLILNREDLTDYNVTDPEELLCNKVKVYGRNNKVIPWDYTLENDAWTESIGNPTSDPFYWIPQSGLLAITAVNAPPTPKKGNYMIKVPAQKVTGNWWNWNDDGWVHCHVVVFLGPGSAEWTLFKAYPGAGKKIRLNSAGGRHGAPNPGVDGHLEIWYAWGESPSSWNQLGYDSAGNPKTTIEDDDDDLYATNTTTGFVENPTNDSPLQIKWRLTGFPIPPPFFSFMGCFDLARVSYGDETTTGSEVFTARLKIPSPIAIFSDGGTSFWTLIAGSAQDDSEEVKKGTNSYKVTLSPGQTLDFYHDYSSDQDYTTKLCMGIWIYGQNTNTTFYVKYWNQIYASRSTGYYNDILDDFVGWKWFEPIRNSPGHHNIGSPTGWDHIKCIEIIGSAPVAATITYRFDWLVNSNPLDEVVDLETKASAKKLVFVVAPNYGTYPNGISSFVITFGFVGGGTTTINAQFFGIQSNNWTTIEIPVGEDADGWSEDCVGTLDYIEFKLTSSFIGVPSDNDFLLLDWIHFEGARWYGENEDATSENTNGIRFKELFDDTLYSDTAATRRAVEYIKKFKDPIITIKDVEVDYIGMENLDPGKVLVVKAYKAVEDVPNYSGPNGIPEFPGDPLDVLHFIPVDKRQYRIETIEHHLEENDYYVRLILSLDPIYFEGNVYLISERVRRMEQRGNRKPAANPTEVD